ncbi:MAG: ABC transporter transmembrane domain-containing protein, partial [Geminicoccaceae bacterium]
MRHIFRLFFRAEGANPWSVLLALLLATVAEGVGLLSLLPLLAVATEGTEASNSVVYRIVEHGLAILGLEPSLETLLPIVVSAVIVRALLTLLAMRHVGNSVAEVSTRLRQRLLRALLQVHWSFLARQPVGRIANAMSNDATRAGQAYLITAQFVTSLIETTVYAVVALLISWQLALASLALGLAIALSLRWLV